jgi:hypothetical protein
MAAGLAVIGVTRAAKAVFQREEGMFHPGVADLFEPLGVVYSTAHSIKILRNDRVIGLRQRKPIDRLVSIVTRIGSYRQPDLGPDGRIKLCHVFDFSNDNIRARNKVRDSETDSVLNGWQNHRFRFAINNLVDLDRLHRRADGDLAHYRPGV